MQNRTKVNDQINTYHITFQNISTEIYLPLLLSSKVFYIRIDENIQGFRFVILDSYEVGYYKSFGSQGSNPSESKNIEGILKLNLEHKMLGEGTLQPEWE